MPKCRSCDADILWAELNGKPHPFDPSPTTDGMFIIIRGAARRITTEDEKLHRERFTSHFATCPDAEKWRAAR